MLRTGLEMAPWTTVDDTGARHKAQNGICTQIGNDNFTAFVTTQSKSRLNFIELLNAGDTTHIVNDAATAYSASMSAARRDRAALRPTAKTASPTARLGPPT